MISGCRCVLFLTLASGVALKGEASEATNTIEYVKSLVELRTHGARQTYGVPSSMIEESMLDGSMARKAKSKDDQQKDEMDKIGSTDPPTGDLGTQMKKMVKMKNRVDKGKNRGLDTKTTLALRAQNISIEATRMEEAWATLNSELTHSISANHRASTNAYSRMDKKNAKVFKALAATMAYQKKKFEKLKGELTTQKEKLAKSSGKQELKINRVLTKAEKDLGKANEENDKKTKEMKEKVTIVLDAATGGVVKKLEKGKAEVAKIMKDSNEKVQKEFTAAGVVEKDLGETHSMLEATSEGLQDGYDNLDKTVTQAVNDARTGMDKSLKQQDLDVKDALGAMDETLHTTLRDTLTGLKDQAKQMKKAIKKVADGSAGAIKKAENNLDGGDKDFLDVVAKKEETITAGTEEIKGFKEEADEKVVDLESVVDRESELLSDNTKEMGQKIMDQAGSIGTDAETDFGKLQEQVEASGPAMSEAMKLQKAKFQESLGTAEDAASLGLGGLKDKLGGLDEVMQESLDVSKDWQLEFDGMLGSLNSGLREFNADSMQMLADLGGDIDATSQQGGGGISGFSADLLSSLGGMGQELSGDISATTSAQSQAVESTEEQMARMLDNAKNQINAKLGTVDGELKSMGGLFSKSLRDQKNANLANADAVNGILTKDVPGLQAAERANRAATKGGIDAMQKGLVDGQVGMSSQMSDQVGKGKDNIAGGIAAGEEKAAGEMNSYLQKTAGAVDGQVTELSVLEKSMSRGVASFTSDASQMHGNMKRLEMAARKVNERVAEHFSEVNSLLSADKLNLVESEDELNREMQKRQAALEGLAGQHLAKMSAEKQAEYNAMLASRKEKMAAVMNNSEMTFKEKKQAMAELDAEIQQSLADFEGEAKMEAHELQAIQDEQVHVASMVHMAAQSAHTTIDAGQLLSSKNEAELEKQLRKRTGALKDAVMNSGVEISAKTSGKMDAVLAEANDKIKEIHADQNMSDEEKRLAIDKIDAATQHAVANLAAHQVATDQELDAYLTDEEAREKSLAGEMQNVRDTLSDGQMAYSEHLVKEKKQITERTMKLVNLVNAMSAMLEADQGAMATDAASSSMSSALTEARLKMKALAQEQHASVSEAMQMATLAEEKSGSSARGTESDITNIEGKLGQVEELMESSGRDMLARLKDEEKGRDESNRAAKAFLLANSGSILDQLNAITNILVHSVDASSKKQEQLLKAVAHLRETMLKHVADSKRMNDLQKKTTDAKTEMLAKEEEDSVGWEASNSAALKENQQNMINDLNHLEVEETKADTDAKSIMSDTGSNAIKDIAKEEQHLTSGAEKDAKVEENQIMGILDDTGSFMSNEEKQAKKSMEKNKVQLEETEQRMDGIAKKQSHDLDALMGEAKRLVDKIGRQDHQIGRLQNKVALHEKNVEMRKDSKLQVSLVETTRPKSHLVESPAATLRMEKMQKKLDAAEKNVETVEAQDRALKLKLQALRAMKSGAKAI